jgi:HK97 gp10 family phage protein
MPGSGALRALGPATDEGALVALTKLGLEAVNTVKAMLSRPGSGRQYGNHRASAPGQPPAVDTGRLRSSYAFQVGRDGRGPYVDVGTNVEYAKYLEFGTSLMAARPHLRPAIELLRVRIQGDLVMAISTAQRAALARFPREIILP